MARCDFIAGPNFSGRSAALHAMLRDDSISGQTFFVGPYAEAALSGLTSSVRDEIALYRSTTARGNPFTVQDFSDMQLRDPQSLSGGEQVMLALYCFSQSDYRAIAIDTALEQLDPANRAAALKFLETAAEQAILIDNRAAPANWQVTQMLPAAEPIHAVDWKALERLTEPHDATSLSVNGLSFAYADGKEIFADAAVALEPGHAYRVAGANGAGKTTLFKILVGALAPRAADMTLDGLPYRPWRDGNRALALATQNPDQQWCGATLREDFSRRRKVFEKHGDASLVTDERLETFAHALGAASLDVHVYELPLAARKRLSWIWPFAGAHPWIMLDEPTVGQDHATRQHLARHIAALCASGYGVLFVTHDDEFAGSIAHRVMLVADRAITLR